MSLTRTTCPYCGVGCGVLAGPDGTIKGDPEHPANFGRLCSKGAALGETIGLEGRLLRPQVNGAPATWDVALDLVAEKFSAAIREFGPDSVAFYGSGQLLTEDYYVANKLMKGFIGSANIDTNSRLCMASSVAGHKRAFGADTVPGTYEDLEQADLIVLVGSNLAWCHPVLHQRIAAAKDGNPKMRVVNIDPRKTATSDLADMHLRIRPDGDVAMFNGLLAYIAEHGAVDAEYVSRHVNGFEQALDATRATDLLETGLNADELEAFFQLWTRTEKVVTVYSQGVNQSRCGTDKVNAILNCHLATGRIGKVGAGPFSVTGQPNAMGGREVGGLANMLVNHLDIENAAHREAVQSFWNSPTMCTQAGLKAVDLFKACASGQIKALWVMSTNPAVSMPDADGVAAAIKSVPFVAVSDIMARTDTTVLADVVLPAAGWGEKEGMVTNSERRMSRQRAFLPMPGDARADWKIVSDVATRMGFAEAFAYETAEDVFAEYRALDAAMRPFGRDLDLSALSGVAYDDIEPTQWPRNGARFFADGAFYHADGKAKMLPISASPFEQDELTLNTGRNRDQWHTMSRTGKSPRLGAHLAEPYVEMNPFDAAERGIISGDLVKIESAGGSSILRALVREEVARSQLFAPMHWTRENARGGVVNSTLASDHDPVSGQPALKMSTVVATKYDARWYGFFASAQMPELETAYGAVARTQTGWQAEMAGDSAPEDWEVFVRGVGVRETATCAKQFDPTRGTARLAFSVGGKIEALFFAARTPVVVSRSQVVALIGQEVQPIQALAGRVGTDQPDPGATICACFNVGRNTVLSAIEGGAASVADIGDRTCAGTNCGSCKPELAQLLAGLPLRIAAQ